MKNTSSIDMTEKQRIDRFNVMSLMIIWLLIQTSTSIQYETPFENLCHLYIHKRQPRIAGGSKVQHRIFYPFQVSVRYKSLHICGGTIIHARFILTAAHCAFHNEKLLNLEECSIVVGDLTVYEPKNSTVRRKIWRRHQHPRYFSTLIQNDIALLELEEPLENNEYIRTIALSSKDPNPESICRVSGWGLTKEGGTVLIAHPYLKEIEVSILPSEECSQFFSWMSFDDSKICGFSEKGCPHLGDSGGPLICNGHLSGVISFGRMHQCVGAANCFTSTQYHHNWIQYIISRSEYERINGEDLPFKFINIFNFFDFVVKSLKKFFIS